MYPYSPGLSLYRWAPDKTRHGQILKSDRERSVVDVMYIPGLAYKRDWIIVILLREGGIWRNLRETSQCI